MESCIYEGRVKHTRSKPAKHEFSYRLFLMYLDLDELQAVFEKRWFWSTSRSALARFRREDHLGPQDQPLAEAVRDFVQQETGSRPDGPIRLLTNLAYFGYCFNPVSFYYCFATDGETVDYIVSEVNNTPWGERDIYVMDCKEIATSESSWRFSPKKKMHVSPFMPMEVEYDWVLSEPSNQLSVFMANSKDGVRIFNASMNLNRRQVTSWSLASMLLKYPFQTSKIVITIYWEALRLWVKRVPFYTHPEKEKEVATR